MTEMVIASKHNFIKNIFSRLKWIILGILCIPSRLLYGNIAGFRNNFFPLRKLKQLQNKFNLSIQQFSLTSREAANSLQEQGAYIIKSKYPNSILDNIVKKYNEMIEDDLHAVSSTNGCSRYLNTAADKIPELKELITPQLQEILTAYYKCSFTITDISAWRNYHVPGINLSTENARYDVFSNTFHNDAVERTSLRLFVLLSNGVSRNTGSFRYHNKLTSENMVRSLGFFSRPYMTKKARMRLLDIKTLKYFEGDIGDAALCNTQECLHASSIPEKGSSRDIIQFVIHPSQSQIKNKGDMFSC